MFLQVTLLPSRKRTIECGFECTPTNVRLADTLCRDAHPVGTWNGQGITILLFWKEQQEVSRTKGLHATETTPEAKVMFSPCRWNANEHRLFSQWPVVFSSSRFPGLHVGNFSAKLPGKKQLSWPFIYFHVLTRKQKFSWTTGAFLCAVLCRNEKRSFV